MDNADDIGIRRERGVVGDSFCARDVVECGSDQFGIAAFEHGFKICEDCLLAVEIVDLVKYFQ